MLTENKTPSTTKKKKRYSPIVFVNNPVKDTEHDVIGFDAQVKTLQDAIDNGATMIGVIADYGTGKSSMTELLCNRFRRRLHPRPIKVNMWDSLTQENITGDISGVSNLTRSFLFQLANGKNAAFSSYINKLLSKNYGNISFASSNPWRFCIFAIISGLLFGLHMMSTVSGTGVIQYLPEHMNKTISFIKALSPWFLVAAIASLLLGLKNLSIVFSHWKMPTRREVEVNDVFDTYRVIAKKITPWCKRKKRLVFIDDLDRVNDKRIIIAFLKELYRFQDSITKNKKQIVFIVSVKPESELKDNSEQPNPPTSNKKDSEGDVKKTDHVVSENQHHKETSLIYPKVFDTTLFLKPIHFDDYDSILLRLIKSAPKKKKALERLIEKDIKKALPYSFRWIKNGTNLTLRDLKDRLNHAVAIMVSLKNKSYENNSAANFEACAAVAYLESQYPSEYYRLIKNEESFAKFIQASYTIVNDATIEEDIYIEVYINVSAVFDIMSDHWDFLERLQSEADLNELSESQLIPVFKVPQTQRFFEYMLSDKTTLELKKKYLKEFYKFKEEKDSIAFQRLICTPTNIKLIDSIDLKESISQRLWETNRNHKGQFTKAWNKEWSKKLSQPQPV